MKKENEWSKQYTTVYCHARVGSPKSRQHRRKLMVRILDELKKARALTQRINQFSHSELRRYVRYCKSTLRLSDSTVIERLSVINHFFTVCDIEFTMPAYKSLGLTKQQRKTSTILPISILEKIVIPEVTVMMGMQLYFGLTRVEAIHFDPIRQIEQNTITVGRTVAYNRRAREIPIIEKSQRDFLQVCTQILKNEPLINRHKRHWLNILYAGQAEMLGLPKNFRSRKHYVERRWSRLYEEYRSEHKTEHRLASELGVTPRQIRRYR